MRKEILPNISTINFADKTLSAFFNDGKAHRDVTPDMVQKILSGELVVTEYQQYALGNVIYVESASKNN